MDMEKPRAVVVDDEESIRALVQFTLERAGFETELFKNGTSALNYLLTPDFGAEIVILDIMLPGGVNGLDICRQLREHQSRVPIILLSAKDEEIDRVLGLELGADDYVTKPFSPRELVARIKAVRRRASTTTVESSTVDHRPGEFLTIGPVTMDLAGHEVSVRGLKIELTLKEFELLQYLMANVNRVLSRRQLLDKIWGYADVQDTRIVDVHVSHLREKIEQDPKHPNYIQTIRGVGYKIVSDS